MLPEGLFHLYVADHITTCVVVQQSVVTDALHGGYETARRCERLKSATGTNAYHCQRAVLVFFLTGIIVDVGERVELVDHDIDVVTADTMTLASDALAFIHTSNGMELTAADLTLFRVEMCSNGIHTCRIAHKNNLVGKLFWLQMQMETRTISIDNQFRFRKMFFIHRLVY